MIKRYLYPKTFLWCQGVRRRINDNAHKRKHSLLSDSGSLKKGKTPEKIPVTNVTEGYPSYQNTVVRHDLGDTSRTINTWPATEIKVSVISSITNLNQTLS